MGCKFSEGGDIQAMLCANLVEFHAHLVCKKHDTMVVSHVSTKCWTIERWGGRQITAHIERVASFLRG